MTVTSLSRLPDELLQQVADLLDRQSQNNLALVSQRAWDVATNAIWRDVTFMDRRAIHGVPEELRDQWDPDTLLGRDEHDDTPIIRKLLVLAQNKRIAAKVRILTHRCHLPLPAIFSELPQICFENATLSSDWRTVQLTLLAVANMDNVRVLRILGGHFNLISALLNGFYGPERKRIPPHLWIESCSLKVFPLTLTSSREALNGLQSLRLRRLRLAHHFYGRGEPYRYSRAGTVTNLHNGIGSTYETTTSSEPLGGQDLLISPEKLETIPAAVKWLNEQTYNRIPQAAAFLRGKEDRIPYPISGQNPSLRQQESVWTDTIGIIMNSNFETLRSINLDWILTPRQPALHWEQYQHFERLSQLRFPHLRALQLRNAVTDNTTLAPGIHLLRPAKCTSEDPAAHFIDAGPKAEYNIDMLTFMEHHPNLECLAWPMDRFFVPVKPREEDKTIRDRAAAVVANLGRTLTTLRIDSYYTSRGEPQTDEELDLEAKDIRIRRRLFISAFAAHMTKLKVLKIEGGIPRDEKRELMRATHRCPLEKVVMIGVSCPLGNTWGVNGDDLAAIDEGHLQFHGLLEPEHEEAIAESTKSDLQPISNPNGYHRAEYGWPPSPPLLYSIALHHASTITELKFCGYNGSPVLHRATAITSPLLHHLRHFHRLRKIIMSFWLLTFFDFDWRESEIIDYWVDSRDPDCMALVPLPPPPPPPQMPLTPLPFPNQAVALDTADIGTAAPAAQDGDGDTAMAGANAAATEWTNTVNVLAALSGQAADTDNMTPDTMMAAALGTGIIAAMAPQDDENTVIPITSDNPDPLAAPATHLPPFADAQDATAPPVATPETNPWEIELHRKFSPQALARGVFDIIGPHLSPIARSQIGGVQVRASFCLGVESGDIFDLDFDVNAKGVVEGSWVGPREESERERWWGKLENRGWFG